ncbi:MAG: NB-ARC domain-containing protein [Cyanobacteria bacterium P01_A01_bin.114]
MFTEAANHWDLDRLSTDLAQVRGNALTETELINLSGLLCDRTPEEIATRRHVKRKGLDVDFSRNLYPSVKKLAGMPEAERISWRDVPRLLQQQGYKLTQASWSQAPDVSVFYGRTEEQDKLHKWISAEGDNCRLVALLGAGGMGKTALAIRLAEALRSQFQCLIWQRLHLAPPLEQVLDSWLQQLPGSTGSLPNGLEAKLDCLSERLHDHRCLLLLDNLDSILQSGRFAGPYQPGYENYGELLRRIGRGRHQSCLLITSREPSKDLVMLARPNGTARSFELSGLEQPAAAQLLEDEDLSGQAHWNQLIKIYRGNPLVLKLIAASIRELRSGSVSDFLNRDNTTLITCDVYYLLQQQLDRLSEEEQQVLQNLAQTELAFLFWYAQVQPTRLWEEMYAATRDFGQRGPYIDAISALDIGMWDTLGKHLQCRNK